MYLSTASSQDGIPVKPHPPDLNPSLQAFYDSFEGRPGRPSLSQHTASPGKAHPAEVSGPSSDPDLNFIRLPTEIRLRIYRELLLITAPICIRPWRTPRSQGGVWTMQCTVSPDSGSGTGTSAKVFTSILRVCKHINEEALEVLYGENIFGPYEISHNVFGNNVRMGQFKHAVGNSNSARVKTATFNLRFPFVYSYYDDRFKTFHDLVDCDLSALHKLSLNTSLETYAGGVETYLLKRARWDILTVAAYIAKTHPRLRQVVWRHESGGTLSEKLCPGLKGYAMVTNLRVDLLAADQKLPNLGESSLSKDFSRRDVWMKVRSRCCD